MMRYLLVPLILACGGCSLYSDVVHEDLVDGSRAHYQNGRELMSMDHETDGAIRQFDKAIEEDPDFVDAYLYRAVAETEKGSYDSALADVNRAVALQPRNPECYYFLGHVCRSMHAYDQAEEGFREVITLSPHCAKAYFFLGDVYESEGRHNLATESYGKACDLGFGKACIRLGRKG